MKSVCSFAILIPCRHFYPRNVTWLCLIWIISRLHQILDGIVVLLVKLGAHVNVVVAETYELTLHPIHAFQRVNVQGVHVVNIPKANILPELRREKYACKHEWPPV